MQLQGRNIQQGMSGNDVGDLHRDLTFLGFTVPPDELNGRFFGPGTAAAVVGFRQAQGLPATPVVDLATAEALGRAVAASGTRAESPPTREYPPPAPSGPSAPSPPGSAAGVPPDPPASPPPDLPGTPGSSEPPDPPTPTGAGAGSSAGEPGGDVATETAQARDVDAGGREARGDGASDSAPPDAGSPDDAPGDVLEVEGELISENDEAVAGATLRFYEHKVANRVNLVGETVTGPDGDFAVPLRLSPTREAWWLDIRWVDPEGREVPLVDPHDRPDLAGPLVLVLDPGPEPDEEPATTPSEHDLLTAALALHLGDAALSELEEDDEQADVSLLAEATGWAPELIALEVAAGRLAAVTAIDAAALYGMLRVGLPATGDDLAQVSPEAVTDALDEAVAAGVVDLGDEQIDAALERFEQFARDRRRDLVVEDTPSSYGELLAAAGLDGDEQDRLDALFVAHGDDPETLWAKVDEAGLPTDRIRAATDLAALTGNNARLVADLRQRVETPGGLGASLVGEGLHRAEAWVARLEDLAAGDEDVLAAMVPPSYGTGPLDERLAAYAEDLADEVHAAFPTEVIGRKVTDGELELPAADEAPDEGPVGDDVRAAVGTVLARAAARGFELGETPLNPFLDEHGDDLFTGFDDATADAAAEQLATLQRLYQVTASDDGLQVLEHAGFSSAHEIAEMPREDFLDAFGPLFPSDEEADLTWRRAQQIDAVTLNLVEAAKHSAGQVDLAVLPALPVLDPGHDPQPGAGDPADAGAGHEAASSIAATLKRFPALEELFGSLDHSACDHCESVLSPAAYFVDVLQFLDPRRPPERGDRPFDVLARRRPDLAHVALTCDNTETALPYIDVVNEILERYVVSGTVTEAAALDNEGRTSDELIAEPRHLLAPAYDRLRESSYPPELPFDLWLETVRAFAGQFETPFWQILDALRPGDELHRSDEGALGGAVYGRAAVAYERLGLSPADVVVLTTPDPHTSLAELYGEPAGTPAEAVRDALVSAVPLARRLGVTYEELAELVGTRFVNPRLGALEVLRSYRVSVSEARAYLSRRGARGAAPPDGAGEKRLRAVARRLGPEGRAWLGPAWARGDLARAVVLSDPELGEGPDSFDTTVLQMGDGNVAHPMVLVLLNHFVRVWRRLGWSIEETDRALTACLPEEPDLTAPERLGPAMATALLGISYLDLLVDRLRTGRAGRAELPALWGPLDDRRYQELFPPPPVAPDDPDGAARLATKLAALRPEVRGLSPEVALNVVTAGRARDRDDGEAGGTEPVEPVIPDDVVEADIPLIDGTGVPASIPNLGELRAALGLTADEVRMILASAGGLPDDTLSLETVSLLYRHELLARCLDLGIRDVLALVRLSGIDPFGTAGPDASAGPDGDVPSDLPAGDHPGRQTLRFVDMVREVRAAGLSVEDLEFLLDHRFDPVGPHRHAERPPLDLVRSLATVITRVRTEHAVPGDPLTYTDEVVARDLSLVLEPEAAATFMDLWTGARRLGGGDGVAGDGGDAAPDDRDHGNGHVDDGGATAAGDPVDPVAGRDRGPVEPDFVEQHLARRSVEGVGQVGFLATEGLDLHAFFTPTPHDQDRERVRRAQLVSGFLPYLQGRLIHRLVVDTVASLVGADPDLVDDLLTDPAVLDDPERPGRALLDAYVEAGSHGLIVGGARGGPADPAVAARPAAEDEAPVPEPEGGPAGGGQMTGYLEVPASGRYRLSVRCPHPGVRVTLAFEHRPDPVLRAASTDEQPEPGTAVELQAGRLYSFTLDHDAPHDRTDEVTLWLEGEELSRRRVTDLITYPRAQIVHLQRLHLLVTKTLRLVEALSLTGVELAHLVRHPDDFDGLDLGELPTRAEDASPERSRALFGQVRRLIGWARLRDELRADPDDLVDLVSRARRVLWGEAGDTETTRPRAGDADPVTTSPEETVLTGLCERLGAMVRRDPEVVREAADQLGMAATAVDGRVVVPGFKDERGLARLWRVLSLTDRLGVDPAALGRWATPTPDAEVAHDVRAAIMARYEPGPWRRLVQPVSDRLRQRRRDALVAHIVHKDGFDRPEQLFEYFLVDPGTEPVVHTSRLRLAISSVQTFVQRCFLGLEPEVDPRALDADRWEWMKRYRVWEANRKIFLWPENWLEPEFRDMKTPLFTELEGRLLESDVDGDDAEDALVGYLRGLEQVARLDVRAVRSRRLRNDLHVVARTFGPPHQHFYRALAGGVWTPWEPVPVDISGDHVTMIDQEGRLHLFWVTFLEKPVTDLGGDDEADEDDDEPRVRLTALQRRRTERLFGELLPGQAGRLLRMDVRARGAAIARHAAAAARRHDLSESRLRRRLRDYLLDYRERTSRARAARSDRDGRSSAGRAGAQERRPAAGSRREREGRPERRPERRENGSGPKSLAEMTAGDLVHDLAAEAEPRTEVEVTLHWVDYVRGEWSDPVVTTAARPVRLDGPFRPVRQYVSASLDLDGIAVDLTGQVEGRFLVRGRHSPVTFSRGATDEELPAMLYGTTTGGAAGRRPLVPRASYWTGKGNVLGFNGAARWSSDRDRSLPSGAWAPVVSNDATRWFRLALRDPVPDRWGPFFCTDEEHTFLVVPVPDRTASPDRNLVRPPVAPVPSQPADRELRSRLRVEPVPGPADEGRADRRRPTATGPRRPSSTEARRRAGPAARRQATTSTPRRRAPTDRPASSDPSRRTRSAARRTRPKDQR